MKFTATPAKTYAVLVGIEQYGHGIRALVGPAVDALSMCCWMLSKGVPSANIQLLISEADSDNPAVVAERARLGAIVREAGVSILLPHQNELERALSGATLGQLDAARGSAFWVYWSGHGLLTHATRERMVVTGDATEHDYYAVDLENMANRLRLDPRLVQFTQQLLIVDACSTWTKPSTSMRYSRQRVDGMKNQNTLQTRIFVSVQPAHL